MRFFICLFFISALYSSSFAQVNGFLGKRFALGVNGFFSPNLSKKDISSINQNASILPINKRYALVIGYTLTNKWDISSSLHLQKSATNNLVFDNAIENEPLGYAINIYCFGFSAQRFLTRQSDFIAPVGKYFSFGLLITNFSLVDVKGHVFKPNTVLSSGRVSSLTLGFGRKRVFFKTLLFNYGIEAALPLFKASLKNDTYFNEFVSVPQKRIKQLSLVNFKVGLCYLL